eukprot:scaffold216761_cov27-Tisochrysis_lutea.AAC.1
MMLLRHSCCLEKAPSCLQIAGLCYLFPFSWLNAAAKKVNTHLATKGRTGSNANLMEACAHVTQRKHLSEHALGTKGRPMNPEFAEAQRTYVASSLHRHRELGTPTPQASLASAQ